MIIDIKGHSGCNIDIIEDNGNLYVKKSTNDLKYLDRLNLQAEKQKNDNCLSDSLRNPVIHDVVKTENECYMVMDYIYAKNFIDYFENASPSAMWLWIPLCPICLVNLQLPLRITSHPTDPLILIIVFPCYSAPSKRRQSKCWSPLKASPLLTSRRLASK